VAEREATSDCERITAASILVGNIVAKRPQQFAAQQPRKRFGQNFLHRRRRSSIASRGPSPPRQGDHLVEIGPGRGALTEALVESGCRLHAIELDRDLSHTTSRRLQRPP
jgi:16S rRNA A1518/A1519 N6-dimethyltransferase RsmA/KsgA/DIM1 with predicted DNA glycosylase/AP lyase activity